MSEAHLQSSRSPPMLQPSPISSPRVSPRVSPRPQRSASARVPRSNQPLVRERPSQRSSQRKAEFVSAAVFTVPDAVFVPDVAPKSSALFQASAQDSPPFQQESVPDQVPMRVPRATFVAEPEQELQAPVDYQETPSPDYPVDDALSPLEQSPKSPPAEAPPVKAPHSPDPTNPPIIQPGVYLKGRMVDSAAARSQSEGSSLGSPVSPCLPSARSYDERNRPFVLPDGMGIPLDTSDVVPNPPEPGKPTGIIGPHKLPNPVRDSREHQRMYREMKDKYKKGELLQPKSELQQKMFDRRDKVAKKQLEEEKRANRTSLDIALEQRADKLKQQETPVAVVEEEPKNELERAFQKVKLSGSS